MTELSLKAMQTALRKTTEALASELASPTAITPDWSETEWLVARAVSAIHGVSALLADRLRWRGPTGWAEFLADQKAHTAKRFARVEQLLHLIDSRARDEGSRCAWRWATRPNAVARSAARCRYPPDLCRSPGNAVR
jgi:hypothetical protein